MTELTIFRFEDRDQIRVVQGPDGEPWFVAVDICRALGITNSSDAMSRLDDDEKGVAFTDTPGGRQQVAIVNESGLYSLILRSNKPEAKRLKKYVTGEVLPSIRKTGMYAAKTLSTGEMLVAQAQAHLALERQVADLQADMAHVKDTLDAANGQPQMMTVAAYARWHGLRLSMGEIQGAGQRATRYSNQHGYPIETAAHPIHGKVNKYHVDVLRVIFAQRSLLEAL